MRWRGRWATLVWVAALVLALSAAGGAWAHDEKPAIPDYPQFERCLEANGAGEPGGDGPVQVCKTVRVTKVTVYQWGLTKTPAPPTVHLAPGQTGPLAYTLAATPTPTVSWIVDGDVVVRNLGAKDVVVKRLTDDLTLPDGSRMSEVLATDVMLPGLPCAIAPEEVFHYSFTVPAETAQATKTTPSNSTTAEWDADGDRGTSAATAPVSFADTADTPQVTYFRTAVVTDQLDPAPPGVGIGSPASAGPFSVAADDPSTRNPVVMADVTNATLRCGSSSTITNMATLRSNPSPERRNNPTLLRPAPPEQTVHARALVLVTSPECAPPPVIAPQSAGPPPTLPQVTPAGIPQPVKPAKPKPCPVPDLAANVIGPKQAFTGQKATWLVTVRNRSRIAARRIVVQERLPAGFSVVSSTRAFSFNGRLLRFPVARLNGRRSLAIRITMQVANGLDAQRAVHRIRVSASCTRAETAFAPVVVRPGIAPAVTG